MEKSLLDFRDQFELFGGKPSFELDDVPDLPKLKADIAFIDPIFSTLDPPISQCKTKFPSVIDDKRIEIRNNSANKYGLGNKNLTNIRPKRLTLSLPIPMDKPDMNLKMLGSRKPPKVAPKPPPYR